MTRLVYTLDDPTDPVTIEVEAPVYITMHLLLREYLKIVLLYATDKLTRIQLPLGWERAFSFYWSSE